MGRLEPINFDSYQPLREAVCEALRDAIRKGILEPGERLMEVQVAEELGISRTPVREAIRKLEQEGYVIMMPRRGTYVADVSESDVKEFARRLKRWQRDLPPVELSRKNLKLCKVCCLRLKATLSKKILKKSSRPT